MPVDRRLVSLTSEDGQVHDALFEIDERAARGRERATGRRTAIVHVHGIMGNFLVGTLRFYPSPLARAGFPVLVLETRMANVGQLFGQAIFEEAIRDVEAAVRWLRAHDYDTIILSGLLERRHARHPLRGHPPRARPARPRLPRQPLGPAPVDAAPGRALRRGSRLRRADRHRAARDRRQPRRARGRPPLRGRAQPRARAPRPADSEVYTYRTWWHSRGPAATAAMAFRQIGQVWAPILLVQGTGDDVVQFEEAVALAHVARTAGNRDVTVIRINDAPHSFEGHEIDTLDAVTSWLRERV